jgi:hypothetical protein
MVMQFPWLQAFVWDDLVTVARALPNVTGDESMGWRASKLDNLVYDRLRTISDLRDRLVASDAWLQVLARRHLRSKSVHFALGDQSLLPPVDDLPTEHLLGVFAEWMTGPPRLAGLANSLAYDLVQRPLTPDQRETLKQALVKGVRKAGFGRTLPWDGTLAALLRNDPAWPKLWESWVASSSARERTAARQALIRGDIEPESTRIALLFRGFHKETDLQLWPTLQQLRGCAWPAPALDALCACLEHALLAEQRPIRAAAYADAIRMLSGASAALARLSLRVSADPPPALRQAHEETQQTLRRELGPSS